MIVKSNLLDNQLTFVLLQLGDVITTLIVIANGGAEGNPLVAHFMLIGTLQGLILSKVLVLAAAFWAVRTRRFRVIRWSNIAFAAIVSWNVLVILLLALVPRRA